MLEMEIANTCTQYLIYGSCCMIFNSVLVCVHGSGELLVVGIGLGVFYATVWDELTGVFGLLSWLCFKMILGSYASNIRNSWLVYHTVYIILIVSYIFADQGTWVSVKSGLHRTSLAGSRSVIWSQCLVTFCHVVTIFGHVLSFWHNAWSHYVIFPQCLVQILHY